MTLKSGRAAGKLPSLDGPEDGDDGEMDRGRARGRGDRRVQ